jgi:hypothetical protein
VANETPKKKKSGEGSEMKKELILAIVPILVEHIAGGTRDWLADRRAERKQWEKKIEDAKAGKYDTVSSL